MAKLGLTYPQYLVLLVLWEPDRNAHTVKGLADALQRKQANRAFSSDSAAKPVFVPS